MGSHQATNRYPYLEVDQSKGLEVAHDQHDVLDSRYPNVFDINKRQKASRVGIPDR